MKETGIGVINPRPLIKLHGQFLEARPLFARVQTPQLTAKNLLNELLELQRAIVGNYETQRLRDNAIADELADMWIFAQACLGLHLGYDNIHKATVNAAKASQRETPTERRPRKPMEGISSELAAHTYELYSSTQANPNGIYTDEQKAAFAQSAGRIIFQLIRIAEVYGIRLDEAVRKKIKRNGSRFPKELFCDTPEGWTDDQAMDFAYTIIKTYIEGSRSVEWLNNKLDKTGMTSDFEWS